jgi:outer membrane receptor protein involved in Fe transport
MKLMNSCRLLAVAILFAAGAAAAAETYQLDIPAQPLSKALQTFAEQSGIQIVYYAQVAQGRTASRVAGTLSAQEALTQLLTGTNLKFETVNADTVAIRQVTLEGGGSGKDGMTEGTAQAGSALSQEYGARLAQSDASSGTGGGAQGASEGQKGDEAGAENVKLEEIVVTAQKRKENLQDVPISISVLGGGDLDRSTLEGVSEALNRVAGVSVVETSQGGGSQIAVRGVSSSYAHFFGTSTVAYYLDSMPFGLLNSAAAPDSNAYDLARVEVLRGPQGTLYGASALNGVVRVLTNDANLDDFDLKARTTLSTTRKGDQSYRGDLALNLPILPGRLAARIVGGYEDRGGWIDKPNRNEKDVNDGVLKNLRFKLNAQPTDALSIGLSAWLSREDFDSPNTADSPYRSSALTDESIHSEYDAYGLTVGYDFSGFAVSSSTSYLTHANQSQIEGLLPPFLPPVNTRFDDDIWAEELLFSSTHEGPWRWSLGAMYRQADENEGQFFVGIPGGHLKQSSESFAVFGEATRSFNDGEFELTAGARYFEDAKQLYESTAQAFGEAKFDAVSPRVVFTWHPSERLTAYTSYSEGFRSGGPSLSTSFGIPPLEPDTLKNYEIGAKGGLWDGRLSFETALFYIDWQDVQESLTVIKNGTVFAAQVNGDSASGLGVDFAATLTPVKSLALGVTLGWNDLTMDADVNTFPGGVQTLLRGKGERFNYSPEWTAGASLDYNFPLGGAGFEGRFSASANYTSSQVFALYLGGPARYLTSGEEMLFARTSFGIESLQHWSASLFVDNVTNEEGPAVLVPFASPLWTPRPRPRTIGVQFEYHFGK